MPEDVPSLLPDPVLLSTSILPSDGRILQAGRAVHARLPKTYYASAMSVAGARFWESTAARPGGVHIVAIADSGLPLATGIMMAAQVNAVLSFTVISSRHAYSTPDLIVAPGESLLLVDNSIHTGRTAHEALGALGHLTRRTSFVKLFDYGDELEVAVSKALRETYGVQIHSLYEVDDLFVPSRTKVG